MKDKKKTISIIAGILFSINVVISLISITSGGNIAEQIENGAITVWTALHIVGTILIAISIFAKNHKMFAIGSGMEVIFSVSSLWRWIEAMRHYAQYGWDTTPIEWIAGVSRILQIVIWSILVASFFERHRAKTYCITAIGIEITNDLVLCIVYAIFLDYFDPIGAIKQFFLYLLDFYIPIMLTGYVFTDPDYRAKFQRTARLPATSTLSQADKLTKLKGLLDSGVITREEFDEKKKQILGL